MYYVLEPEVAGELGPNCVIDSAFHPPAVSRLHFRLTGWLGDDLLESFPCFVATERIKRAIERNGLSGCDFDAVEITVSQEFREMYPNRQIPQFYWLKPTGVAARHDFGVLADGRLVVSERVLKLMEREARIENCDIEEFSAGDR